MKAKHGNFLKSVFEFDHEYFGISPREAKSMDPQQKLLLHGAVHAMDDAGYVPSDTTSFNPETMGCYIGVATDDYVQNLTRNVDVYYSTGKSFLFILFFSFLLGGSSVEIWKQELYVPFSVGKYPMPLAGVDHLSSLTRLAHHLLYLS